MKYYFASDIHGSQTYCAKLIDIFNEYKSEDKKLILLGDLLYHGPRNDLPEGHNAKAVIELLNGVSDYIYAVRGNCEASVDQMVLNFPCLADYALMTYGKRTLFLTHGDIFNTKNPPKLKDGDILIHGHTHISKIEEFDISENKKGIYINPGSTSIPKENDTHNYMTFENGKFEIINLMNGEVIKSLDIN